jgi:hypothetical protein
MLNLLVYQKDVNTGMMMQRLLQRTITGTIVSRKDVAAPTHTMGYRHAINVAAIQAH